MRRAVLLALVLCGCGGGGRELPAATPTIDMSQFGPRHAVARSSPPPAPLPALHGSVPPGQIGVVGVTGRAGVRPAALETSTDAALVKLSWSAWSAGGASGSGELRLHECQPNCATGRTRSVPARVELSGVKECDGRRYFVRATVTPRSGPAPTSYVRAPC